MVVRKDFRKKIAIFTFYSRPGTLLQAIETYSSSFQTVLAILSWISYTVMSWLYCHVLAILSQLNCRGCLSWLYQVSVTSRLSCLGWLPCHGYPLPAVLSCSTIVIALLLWLSCSGSSVVAAAFFRVAIPQLEGSNSAIAIPQSQFRNF